MDASVPRPATDGQHTLESFGYRQELRRSVATVDLVVYGLVFMVPIAPWAIFGTVYNSTGWMNAFFVVNVLAVGFANAMAAQAATSRLLHSMSRDRQLPSFLSKVSGRQVPMAAILVVSALSIVLVLFFVGQVGLISSLVNFGALFAFCLLHVSVVWHYLVRKKSENYLLHLIVPTLGFLIIAYVLFNADSLAKIGGIVWLGIGAVVFIVNKLRGRGVPQLGDEPAVPGEGVSPPSGQR